MRPYCSALLSALLGVGWITTVHAEELALRVATQDYPHVKAIRDGSVPISGCKVEYTTQSLDELTRDLAADHRFDVIEVELLPYLRQKAAGHLAGYTLVPVFIDRAFQLRNIYIRSDRSIRQPADLRGKKIGVAGYAGTTPTWLRGILQSSWSVKPQEVTWVDTETSGGSGKSLSMLLESGEVDAVFSLDPPKSFGGDRGPIVRLFPEYKSAEEIVFRSTRVFPIVTALAVRQELVDKNAWLPEALFTAFSRAKAKSYANGTVPLPGDGVNINEIHAIMGKNYWSYGVKGNPKSLGTFLRYAKEQKLLPKSLTIETVFEPSTLLLLED